MAFGRKLCGLFLAFALLATLSSAAVITRNYTYVPQNNPTSWVYTNISIVPSAPAPQTSYCVGDNITASPSVASEWFFSAYRSSLSSNGYQLPCFVPSSTINPHRPFNWTTSSQYSQISSHAQIFSNVTSFNSFMSGIGVSPVVSEEKSGYTSPDGSIYGGAENYKADIGFYCTGTIELKSNNSLYNRGPLPYLGAPVTFPTITLTSPGTFKLNTSVLLNGCISSGRTYLNGASCKNNHDNVVLYKDPSFTATSFDSASQTITVGSRYTCSLSAPYFTPTTMTQNAQAVPFSLVIQNNGNSAIFVKNITLMPSSPFSNLIITSPTLPAYSNPIVPGGQLTFSGTVNAPATSGAHTISLNISTTSTTADCTGSVKNCSMVANFAVTVQPPSNPVSCTLAFQNHASTFTAPDSANVTATCLSSTNAVVNCGYLSWTTTATSGAVNPASTTTPPQLSQTLLSFSTVTSFQNNAIVKAQQGSNFSCQLALNVTGPDYTSTITAPANYAQYQVGASFNVQVQTKNIGAATGATTATRVIFNNGAPQNFNIAGLGQQQSLTNSTSFTCPSVGVYKLNSTADANGVLTESNENNNYHEIWINCTAAPPALKPDYISIISAPSTVPLGAAFQVNVTTKNIGPGNATVSSTTRLKIANNAYSFTVRPLLANGDLVVNVTTYNCPDADSYIQINSSADYFNQVGEANRLNNNDTFTVHCQQQLPGNLPNYVPNITAPSAAFVGYSFTASFGTINIGAANATNNSTTRATFQAQNTDFLVAPLQIGQQQIDHIWNLYCASSGTKSLVEDVNYFHNVTESNYADNVQTWPIACYGAPDSCNLSFVNHNSTFYAFDYAPVQATCYFGAAQTACPPFLWQQDAVGGSMNPTNTNLSWMPNSTLSMSGNVNTQLGRKVTATSTLPQMDLSCELAFNVSNGSAIGPDYVVTSITPSPSTVGLGQTVQFTVIVTNQGNVNGTVPSTSTAAFSPGCEIITNRNSYVLPPIDAQDSDISINELACTCRVAGTQNVTVTANPTHVQSETDYTNNDRVESFICQAPASPITCAYFV